MKTTLTLAALALSLAACGAGQNASQTKDLVGPGQGGFQGTQQLTVVLPTGGATTMAALTFPVVSNALEIHSSCTVQLAQLYATYDYGQVGTLAQSSTSANIWYAPSGQTHTWRALQFFVNNFSYPTYCTFTVKAATNPIPYATAQ